MTREETIFLAKKLFTELVFNTAYIEGVNVTFPQTQAILDGAVVNNIPVSDIQTVLNLRDAWRYCIDSIDEPVTLEYVCKVNSLVSRNESLEWGTLRTGLVGISGTEYQPPVPDAKEVAAHLQEILQIAEPQDRALSYFCYAVRAQLFWDGNKRTSTIVASKLLMESGIGVMSIGKSDALGFNEALQHYYDTNDDRALRSCLTGCIRRLERRPFHELSKAASAEADRRSGSTLQKPAHKQPER